MAHIQPQSNAAASDKHSPLKETRKYMLDLLLLLTAPTVMAWYYYGSRALLLITVCIITAVLTEFSGALLFKSKAYISDLSSITTAVIIALCLPASSPYWLGAVAVMFAVAAVKLPFGDSRSLMFSPAAAGLAFITICFPDEFFAYPVIPQPVTNLVPYSSDSFVKGESITHMLSSGNSIGLNVINLIDIAVGNVSGPMGATCLIAMAGGLIYLLFRRPKGATVSISFLLTAVLMSFAFPRIGTSRLISVIMELSGGLLFFGAIMLAGNELIAPKRFISRIFYGAFGGGVAMILRLFSPLEESTVFAILLMNAITPVFDSKIPVLGLEKKHLLKQLDETKLENERLEKEVEEIKKAQLEEEKLAEINAILEPKRSKMVEEIAKNIQINTALEIQDIPDEIPEPVVQDEEVAKPDEQSDAQSDDDIPTLQDISELALKYKLDTDSEEQNGGEPDA